MKKWYLSKTLWVNTLALVAIIAQGVTGHEVLNTEAQGVILTVANIALRAITKQELTN